MGCDCIQELNKALLLEVPGVYVRASTNIQTGQQRIIIPVERRHGKGRKATFISAIFCPQCGTPYESSDEAPAPATQEKYSTALNLLERACGQFEHGAPDKDWLKEYFQLTGESMVLTDEGWIRAEDAKGLPADEVMDRAN